MLAPVTNHYPVPSQAMSFLVEYWMPILLSAVAIFIASSVLHMVIPMHASDHKILPGEDDLLNSMRGKDIPQGNYMFPYVKSMKDMGNDEMIEKYQQGPVGFMTILPSGTPAVGKSLMQWFVYTILVSIFIAYVLSFSLAAEVDYMDVFRISGTIAFMTYGLNEVTSSIWKGQSWWVTFKFGIDGLVYALVTAGVFGTFAA
ncbi:MAG: hypothetical protein ACI9C2_002591 [Gammaproteobacteria bacterium]|jgi:hypothetical protein